MPLGDVLVATDFSDHANLALARAAQLPLRAEGRVVLLHVVDDTWDQATRTPEAQTQLDRLRLELEQAVAGRDLRVTAAIAHGAPYAAIAEHAHHARAELVVVGRHGARSFRDALIGSTAERVIRSGERSVLVVAARPAGPYRRPLVAFDGSDSARLALDLATKLCEPEVHEVDALHVIPDLHRPGLGAVDMTPEGASLHKREQRARAALEEQLATSVRTRLAIKKGDPRTVILGQAQLGGNDLVALGTKGRAGLPRYLLGSVAEGVLRNATCDVLVARMPD